MPDALVCAAVAMKTDGDIIFFQHLRAQCLSPTAMGMPLPTMPVAPKHAVIHRGDMHRTAFALAVSIRFAHQFRHHLFHIPAHGNDMPMAAVGAGDEITFFNAVQAPTATASAPK